MADNIETKQILVNVELNSNHVKKEMPALLKEIQDLTDAQKVLEVQGQKNGKQWIENAAGLRQLKAEVRENNKYIDNTAKALNAQNNSIAQNRALLSLLTAEHIKLGQANGNTKEQVDASAKTIRNLTTTLKDQEKQIGQTYRNVGNYSDSIREVVSELGGAIPGFQQFGAVMQSVQKVAGFMPSALANIGVSARNASNQISNFVGFKQFGTQASEVTQETNNVTQSISGLTEGLETAESAAETIAPALNGTAVAAEGAAGGFTVMGAAVTGAIGVIAAVAVAIYGVIQYLKTLDSFGDTTAQIWAGMKASFTAAADSIRAGEYRDLADNMERADFEARHFTEAMQDLGDAMVATDVHSAKAEAAIGDLMLKMRNKRITPQEEQKYFDQIQAISTKNYNERKKNANGEYDIAIREAINGKYLSEEKIKRLKKEGVDYAIVLENNDEIASGSYKKIADAQKKQIAAEQFYQSVRDRSQNRLDAKQVAEEAKADAAKRKQESEEQTARNKAEQEARRQEQQRQREAEARTEAENQRKASVAREMALIYEEYGDRVLAADTSYNNEIAKLQKFLDRKLITQAVYNSNAKQLTHEHEAVVAKIIDDFRKQDETKYRAANNELANVTIQNIDNETERTISGLKQRNNEAMQQVDAYNNDRIEAIKALDKEIKDLSGIEQQEAIERRDNERVLLQVSETKRTGIIKQTEKDIYRIRKNALDQQNKLKDSNDTDEAVTKFGANSAQALAARQQALLDNYNAEVSNEALTAAAKLEIERKYLADRDALERQSRNNKIELSVQAEQTVQSGVFDLLSQGLQQGSAKILAELDARKSAELENNSLTNTQKKLIEQKYAKLEKTEKEKAFKANQKLQVANILINGAVGISKTIAEMGFLPAIPFVALTAASTAFSIAKVLSAKPGFAKGGQFESDGRGAMLPGYSKTDNTNARLRSGEAVVVSEAMRVPWARNAVSSINEMFGGRAFGTGQYRNPFVTPGFATGGVFTDGGNANRYYSAPVYDSEGLANSLAYQLINNFPPIVADIKDIISQQAIKIQTDNRVNL